MLHFVLLTLIIIIVCWDTWWNKCNYLCTGYKQQCK